MIVFPNCKINLGLRILRKRADGYHDLESLFYPVGIRDALEIIPLASYEHSSAFPFSLSGAALQGQPTANLCVRAYKLLKKNYPDLPRVRMHLHKTIPAGAGLGGGSADAAFTLVVLNRMFRLGISTEQLLAYAAELGSDCPFFILNKPCLAGGRGEKLEEIPLSLKGYRIMLVNPGIHIETAMAFVQIIPAIPERSIRDIIRNLPFERWKDELFNDFEKAIFPRHTVIADIKDELYRQGAVFASMSGSGSTVYGFFPPGTTPASSFPSHYFTRVVDAEY